MVNDSREQIVQSLQQLCLLCGQLVLASNSNFTKNASSSPVSSDAVSLALPF
jgi:hypothetical protein